MGEHFYKVVLPRLKKVLAGFASGISKECEFKGGGAFRYYELESYEEALLNCEYVLNQSVIASERSECDNPQKELDCHEILMNFLAMTELSTTANHAS